MNDLAVMTLPVWSAAIAYAVGKSLDIIGKAVRRG